MPTILDAPASIVFSDVNADVLIDTPMELVFNEDAVKKSLEAIFTTPYASRPFRRKFGTKLLELLHEPVDRTTASRLETMLKDTSTMWEPRIASITVSVLPDPENQQYYVEMRYIIPGLSNKMVNHKFNISK